MTVTPQSVAVKTVLAVLLVFVAGGASGWVLRADISSAVSGLLSPASPTSSEENAAGQEEKYSAYTQFILEVYDIIQQHYWQTLSDQELAEKFRTEMEALLGNMQPQVQPPYRAGLAQLAEQAQQSLNEKQKRQLALLSSNRVLQKLEPAERSALYSPQEKEKLNKRITSPDPVLARAVSDDINYLRIKKFTKSGVKKFRSQAQEIANKNSGADTLILDLRNNAGGSFDILSTLLGHFIGNNEYAFELFQRGETQPFKTQAGWIDSLVPYKRVVVLINGNTQSSAEVTASTLKTYNVGVLVGTKTKGWGTVERTFPIETTIDDKQYSAFLVHSVTLGPQETPIEGNGVAPDVNISREGWQSRFLAYHSDTQLVEAIERVWDTYNTGNGTTTIAP